MGSQAPTTSALPPGYDEDDARQDRRDLATLRCKDVNWRVRRRLRHRVGGEEVLVERIAAWDRSRADLPAPRSALVASASDSIALAAEYLDICSALYGARDPEVVANADAIARGAVPPWEARPVIAAERRRAEERSRLPAG